MRTKKLVVLADHGHVDRGPAPRHQGIDHRRVEFALAAGSGFEGLDLLGAEPLELFADRNLPGLWAWAAVPCENWPVNVLRPPPPMPPMPSMPPTPPMPPPPMPPMPMPPWPAATAHAALAADAAHAPPAPLVNALWPNPWVR